MFDLSKYVKLAPWLQFVGLMLVVGGQLSMSHWFGKPLAFVGVGIALAGLVYRAIYQ